MPPEHDVTGTAYPGSTVTLWADDGDDGSWVSTGHTTVADATTGAFGFTGHTPALVGDLAWRVEANDMHSAPVHVTVRDEIAYVQAGSPGHFEPTNATPPVSGTDMLTLIPNPATAWASGQYVTTQDGTEMYWAGESWAEGRAP